MYYQIYNGMPYSGVYTLSTKIEKQTIKIADGLRNGTTVVQNLETGEVAKIKYKNGYPK